MNIKMATIHSITWLLYAAMLLACGEKPPVAKVEKVVHKASYRDICDAASNKTSAAVIRRYTSQRILALSLTLGVNTSLVGPGTSAL